MKTLFPGVSSRRVSTLLKDTDTLLVLKQNITHNEMCGLIITSLKSVNFNQNKKTWKTLAILMMMMSLITMIWWSECNRCLRHFRGPWSLTLSRGGGTRWPVVITHYFQTTTDKLFISCPAMMTSHQIVISQMVPVIMTSSPVNRNSWASFYNLTAVSQCKYFTSVINISLMKYFPKAWLQWSQWSPGQFLGDRQGRHQESGLTNGQSCFTAIHNQRHVTDNL